MTAVPDLSRLNDAERHILSLLAEGHTAKSIAAETGRTEGAVNERLREARRKTGVGSSRELARLLRAQENRGEKIGLVPDQGAESAPSHVPLRARWQGVLIMIVIGGVAAAALVLFSPGQQAPVADDPLFAVAADGADFTPSALRAKMRAETRDEAWATSTEATLRQHYDAVSGVDATALQVTCGATLCEVLGRSAAGSPAVQLKRALAAMRARPFLSSVERGGLHNDAVGSHSDDDSGAYQFSFFAYWRRTKS